MKHPGKMRVALATAVLEWWNTQRGGPTGTAFNLVDPMFGVGSIGLAAAYYGARSIQGIEIDEHWARLASDVLLRA